MIRDISEINVQESAIKTLSFEMYVTLIVTDFRKCRVLDHDDVVNFDPHLNASFDTIIFLSN